MTDEDIERVIDYRAQGIAEDMRISAIKEQQKAIEENLRNIAAVNKKESDGVMRRAFEAASISPVIVIGETSSIEDVSDLVTEA